MNLACWTHVLVILRLRVTMAFKSAFVGNQKKFRSLVKERKDEIYSERDSMKVTQITFC